MTHARPTSGNTYAIERFSPEGPSGYVAVHDDGTHGPLRTTRTEAEADYAQAHAMNATHTLAELIRDTRTMRQAISLKERAGELADLYYQAGYDEGYADQFWAEHDTLIHEYNAACDRVEQIEWSLLDAYDADTAERLMQIANFYA